MSAALRPGTPFLRGAPSRLRPFFWSWDTWFCCRRPSSSEGPARRLAFGLSALAALFAALLAALPVALTGQAEAPDSLPAFTIPELPAGLELVLRESTYNPTTAAGRELIRNVPPHSDARTGPPAFTEYSIRPTWTPRPEGDICRAASASIRVEVQVSMPLDVGVSQETWLRRHENGHVQMIVAHSIRLLEGLNALEGISCPRLTWRAESLVRRIDRELAHAHARYDGRGQDRDLPQALPDWGLRQ